MKSERIDAIRRLRSNLVGRASEVIGEHHTLGSCSPILPEEVSCIVSSVRVKHDEMLAELNGVYDIGDDNIQKEIQSFADIEKEIYDKWIKVAWLHNQQKKDVIVSLISLVAAHFGGKVYQAQLPKYLYYITYRCLLQKGFSLTDLVWHASEPRTGSVIITSRQLDLMSDFICQELTVSSPSMRSSYLVTKDKVKKISREFDGMVGGGISDFVRSVLDNITDNCVLVSAPVALWRKGYRPEGDRLLLEKAAIWDSESTLSGILTGVPREMLEILSERSQ